jgi:hypothetical protein
MTFLNSGKPIRPTTKAPDDPLDAAFKGLQPGAYAAREESHESGSRFLIAHRTAEDGRKIYRCDETQEARKFLEVLIANGVDREDIELFRASKVPFSLSYRTVVEFQVA